MQKLKIGFDAKRLFHNKSGLGNYARTLVANLKKYHPDHEYHLFVPSLPKNESSLIQSFLQGGFIIHTNTTMMPDAWWRSVGCASIINKLGLDIFHGLSHELPFGIASSTKKIVTFHDVIYAKMPHLFSKLDALIYNLKYSSACKRAEGVIAISESTAKDIDELYSVAAKTKTIYQACDDTFINKRLEDTNRDYYLYVGTINARKNLGAIVKAYQLLTKEYQLPFHIIGDGGSYKQQVLQELAKTNFQSKFIFHGHVENENLKAFYRGARALIYPSLYEGFGIPIIEAINNGCPVITSNTSSLPEAAGPGAMYINPLDIISLSSAMAAINNTETANGLRNDGFQYVSYQFDPQRLSDQMIKYYLDWTK